MFKYHGGMRHEDRTTRARIRDAAIREVAARPYGTTTVRDIAASAEVSPGSVIHHFGSMDGLHRACNDHVATLIRDHKTEAVTAPRGFDILSSLGDMAELPVAAYLAKAVLGDSPIVADLIDELVDDAVAYMDEGVEAGTILPTADPRGRAAVLLVWSLGGLVLHRHLERLLGVDLTQPDVLVSSEAAPYVRNALDLMARGILTEPYAEQLQMSLDMAWGEDTRTGRDMQLQKG
jgi:AcrR family transcriptional regulator